MSGATHRSARMRTNLGSVTASVVTGGTLEIPFTL
jgi:hypothetical protein